MLPDSDGESGTEASSKRRKVDEEWTKLDFDNFNTEKSKLGQASNQGCTVFNREGVVISSPNTPSGLARCASRREEMASSEVDSIRRQINTLEERKIHAERSLAQVICREVDFLENESRREELVRKGLCVMGRSRHENALIAEKQRNLRKWVVDGESLVKEINCELDKGMNELRRASRDLKKEIERENEDFDQAREMVRNRGRTKKREMERDNERDSSDSNACGGKRRSQRLKNKGTPVNYRDVIEGKRKSKKGKSSLSR